MTQRLTIAQQNARRAEFDAIRTTRRLTKAEEDEAERLDRAFYFRVYRTQRAERFGHHEAHRRPRVQQGATQ